MSGTRPAPALRGWARRGYAAAAETAELGPVTHGPVLVERALRVPTADGTTLLADHWAPGRRLDGRPEGLPAPVVLVRTPYGRDGNALLGHLFAERGCHVVVNACRGTSGSAGAFEPFRDEVGDGRDVLSWVAGQPWAGPMHTFGFSYVGVTQWALCDGAPGAVVSMLVGVSARSMGPAVFHTGGGTSLETMVTWAYTLAFNGRSTARQALAWARGRRRVARACDVASPGDAFRTALGHDVPYARDWLEHGPGDPWWAERSYGQDVTTVPPVTLVAGWYDLFLVEQVADYRALRDAGRPVRLVVGPWTHTQTPAAPAVAEALRRILPAVDGEPAGVRVAMTGSQHEQWQDLTDWPPPSRRSTAYLHPEGTVDPSPPQESARSFWYDPADPTPMAGGRGLNPFTAGPRSQRERESRPDVLVWTTPELEADLVVAGDAVVHLALEASTPAPDVFVRLCEVDARGVSTTVTDGYRRLPAGYGAHGTVALALAPAAHRFRAGHRLRLQVSGGAHPLHLRSRGAGGDGARVRYTVALGPAASRIDLPVVDW